MITFSRTELAATIELCINPLIVEVIMIAQGLKRCKVRRLLVDTRPSKNILYYSCFKEMSLSDEQEEKRKRGWLQKDESKNQISQKDIL